ncbi:MAG: hypothetical protein H0V17_20510 [Deltaproteobacteria bacterium]|nr:hypothetical protein [Deltaproteobacteria bacterium]
MRAGWVLGVVAVLGSEARAEERATTITVGGLGVMQEGPDSESIIDTASGMRVTLAWEDAPLPYPDRRGYNVGVALVPELIAGGLIHDDRAEALIGAGLRAELRISQREGGLLRINCKSAIYVAARGMVIGENRDVLTEVVFGDYIYLGSPLRLGFEVGVTKRHVDQMDLDPTGMMVGFYLGWAPR